MSDRCTSHPPKTNTLTNVKGYTALGKLLKLLCVIKRGKGRVFLRAVTDEWIKEQTTTRQGTGQLAFLSMYLYVCVPFTLFMGCLHASMDVCECAHPRSEALARRCIAVVGRRLSASRLQ